MSKRVFQHPPESTTGKKYWRSLGQVADTPEFRGWLENEFPRGASEFQGGEVSRRNFMQLMGASMALAGLSFAGCRRPEKHLVPFTHGVEWSIPGKSLFFASSMPTRQGAIPLVVTTHDGRPTKIEGNPLHPATNGASNLHAQSSILDLYDPDRSRAFWKAGVASDSKAFESALDELIKSAKDGAGLAFLLESSESPTRERLRGEIAKRLPKATWAVYEPLAGSVTTGLYADGVNAVPVISKADKILALDCDFLGGESTIEMTRQYAARRKPETGVAMNRLYVVENRYTVTGGMADHRLRLAASQVGDFALAVARELAETIKDDASLQQLVKELPQVTAEFNLVWARKCAADLLASKGASLVLVGARQPEAVHAIGAVINGALGSFGKTIVGRQVATKPAAGIADVAKAIAAKTVNALVIVGGNPAYNAPADLGWSKLQEQLRDTPGAVVIRVAHHEDETTKLSTWHAPLAHYLESWADSLAFDGSYLSGQPMILPLFGGWSELDVLAKFAGQAKPTGPELIQETFREIVKPTDFTVAWSKFLHDGFNQGGAPKTVALTLATGAVAIAKEKFSTAILADKVFEVVLTADAKVDDGRYANNGWLQELPDPITKVAWDNVAQVSVAAARRLGVENGDLLSIEVNGRKIEKIPAYITPGHADNSISIALGYGRSFKGRVGGENVGFDAYKLVTSAQPYFAVGAVVKKLGENYPLAITQEHGSLEGRGEDFLREGDWEDFKQTPDFAKTQGTDAHVEWRMEGGKKVEAINPSLYSHPPLTNANQWGMTVDLSTCTGCSSCMVACQSENNIPIVGKEQVTWGREMHWIRTDRYFSGQPGEVADPEMVYEPMLCQHCENAPCETVCPVNATVHSDDGLNVMAYNRCIGTRYCANNCPFKVRRFNFFDYNERKIENGNLYKWNLLSERGAEDTIKMQKNPNVTVRMRGVMEKCTFCVQRIQEAKIAAKVKAGDSKDVRIPDKAFTVACAQACPSDAITFGDVKNPESDVSKLRTGPRGYRLLEYLNVNTRISYLARIRNQNKEMPDFVKDRVKHPKHHGADNGGHA